MNLNLSPNEYPFHRCLSRETVSTDAVECIELVAINVTRNTPRRFLYVYVLRDTDLNFGILDAFGIGGPHTSTHDTLWFEATTVEECIASFQSYLQDAQQRAERTTL